MHLTSSRFHGGPERQMLGLAKALLPDVETVFASFSEESLCREFLGRVTEDGFPAIELENDTPNLLRAVKEVRAKLRDLVIDVLFCHGYKAGLTGWWAARRVGIPVMAVSRGWTAESRKIRVYEWLDRKVLRRMDRVVCVSQAQANKVLALGIAPKRVVVIPNAIDIRRFERIDATARGELEALYAWQPQQLVGAAGRLSPEKGFDLLVTAARRVVEANNQVGFVLFGEGQLRESLLEQIAQSGLERHVVLAGFRSDLDRLLPNLDLFVQSSHTEGMPNVILEALAAGVPVVATDVGGTGEIIEPDQSGRLIPAGSADALSTSIAEVLANKSLRSEFGQRGPRRIESHFGFVTQAERYRNLLRAWAPAKQDGNQLIESPGPVQSCVSTGRE